MVNRTQAPRFIKPGFFPLKRVESTTLAGGIPLHFINSGDQDIVRIEIIFKAGKWYEPQSGLSALAAKLMVEGTRTFSSFEISKTFEQNGAFFEINSGFDFINFNIYSLSRNVKKLLGVLEEILTCPTFPDEEIATQKAILTQNLKVNREKTSYLASQHFRSMLFGESHPYGRRMEISDVEKIDRQDLSDYFDLQVKDHFEIILSGHFSAEDFDLISRFFSKFKAGKEVLPSYDTNPTAKKHYLEKPGSLQSSLRVGKPMIGKNHPDYYHLLIFNEVLGGYFGSRLMKNLREEKGLTYGVHSSIVPHLKSTYFVIATDVIKQRREEALQEIYKEIQRLVESEIDQDELETVKNYFRGSFLSAINSPFSLADKFKSIYFHQLDYDYYQNLFHAIEDMTVSSIREFGARYFSPEDFIEVSVG